MHSKNVLVFLAISACALLQIQCLSLSLPPFRRFTFAPNSVCIKPQLFVADRVMGEYQQLEFTMRDVPGEGDCMFLAVALATNAAMGLGGSNGLLRSIANETRFVVAQVMNSEEGYFHIEGNRVVRARDLLLSAAQSEGIDCETYIRYVKDGTLQGGGPELTVLSNVLRRPISVYELDWDEDKYKGTIPDVCQLKCMGSFGEIFKDPLSKIEFPAVLSGLQPGAYAWHIHILVVDTGAGEKHAVTLLPQACYM